MENFEEFATDHSKHKHCIACNGCIVDPRPEVQLSDPLWCISCKHRIEYESSKRPGISLPWHYGWDYEKGTVAA